MTIVALPWNLKKGDLDLPRQLMLNHTVLDNPKPELCSRLQGILCGRQNAQKKKNSAENYQMIGNDLSVQGDYPA